MLRALCLAGPTAARRGWSALHAELAQVDPVTAARVPPGDSQRVQRALEVWRLTGRPLSSLHRGRGAVEAPPLVSLEPQDRAWLHARIAERFDAMLAAGLVAQGRRLRERGDRTAGLRAVGCVG